MAEKISSSQESLPMSQETAQMLLDNLGDNFNTMMTDLFFKTTLQDVSNLNPEEILKEKRLEEKLEETSLALAEEKAKCYELSKLNVQMRDAILSLSEKLGKEKKGRQELEIQINQLQEQLAKTKEEFNQTSLMCYQEANAKVEALQKLKEIEKHSYNIHDMDFEGAMQIQLQKQKQEFNEEDDLSALRFGEFLPMEQMKDLFNSQLQDDDSKNTVLKAPSSLPATESWPGQFDFRVSFPSQDNVKAQWVYSSQKNKLYVKKDAPCQINFSTNNLMFDDFYIRTMPFFSSAEHILDKVHRCVNHSMLEIQNNKPEAEHLVRVEGNAQYESDQSGRHSVVVRFENPPAGQQFSSYIYKFACFQSCSGGPNRRPLMLCFTLESRGIVLGRQKVHLKICACPQRDFKIDEKPVLNSPENQTKKKSVKREREECDTTQSGVSELNYDMPVKIRPGPFYLKVEDRRNYEILKFIAKVCLQTSNQPLRRSNLINLIRSAYSTSSEDEEKK